MSGITGIFGAAGALANMFGGGGSSTGNTSGNVGSNSYVPTNQAGADTTLQDIMSRLYGAGSGESGALLPQYRSLTAESVNNPYTGGMQSAADNASAYAMNTLAPQYQQGGTALYDSGTGALPYANTILEQGFDPQNALYDRSLQRLNDQVGVNAARYGLNGPAAAGIANQAASNFNLDWQDRSLGRMGSAATGYGNLINSAGRGIGGGLETAGASVPLMASAGSLPYTTYATSRGNDLSSLANLSQFSNSQYDLPNQTANRLQSYLGLGQTANNNASNAAYNQFLQNQAIGSQLGSSLGAISNSFGPASGWFSGGTSQPNLATNGNTSGYDQTDPFYGF